MYKGDTAIELILCDWEGCVTEPGGGKVPWPTHNIAKLRDIIARMIAIDGTPPLVLCTGRQFPYGEAALQAIGAICEKWADRPSIMENGAGFYYPYSKKIAWHPAITASVATTMAAIRSHIDTYIATHGGIREAGKEYCISVNPPPDTNIKLYTANIVTLLNPYASVIDITHSMSAVDITPKGVDKGTAVQILSKQTGIPLQNMLGIGDSVGDLPMLRVVGTPTAPANADPRVKTYVSSASGYVAPFRTTEGVISILQHYLKY